MLLAIDCGNTHVTFGCMREGAAETVFRIPTDRRETDYGYAAKFRQVLELGGLDPASLTDAVLSCVVPPLTDVLARACALLTGREPLVVGAGVKTGLHIRINDPGTVAPDLVAAAVAARETYPLPVIVVDMGTATTLTAVDADGKYVGGAILPGVGISLHALADETALLPLIEVRPPKTVIGANTVDSMRSGILYGTAGAIDGLIDRMCAELGTETVSLVATGGLASTVCPACRHKIEIDEQLLLRGLALIYARNRGTNAGK